MSYAPVDPRVEPQLASLRALLPPSIEVFVGGTAAPSYAEAIASCGLRGPVRLRDFGAALEALRVRCSVNANAG